MAAGIDDIGILYTKIIRRCCRFCNCKRSDPQKLVRGLGISQMAMVDTNQDPACLAANACLRVMKNNLSPDDIGRFMFLQNHHLTNLKA